MLSEPLGTAVRCRGDNNTPPRAGTSAQDGCVNIPTGNPALNKHTRCRYMISWLPIRTAICQDGTVPAHMLVKLSLGHRCQAVVV